MQPEKVEVAYGGIPTSVSPLQLEGHPHPLPLYVYLLAMFPPHTDWYVPMYMYYNLRRWRWHVVAFPFLL